MQKAAKTHVKSLDSGGGVRVSKHTKGPWECRPSDFMSRGNDISTYFIVKSELGGMAGSEKPNARLIAAAPEMLEALNQIFEITSDSNSNPHELLAKISQIAEEAIKKAEVEE